MHQPRDDDDNPTSPEVIWLEMYLAASANPNVRNAQEAIDWANAGFEAFTLSLYAVESARRNAVQNH